MSDRGAQTYMVSAYKSEWPYKGHGDAWRSEHATLADALALFGALAIGARAHDGHVGLSVDGIEVLAYHDEQLYVATDIQLLPGPHAFEAMVQGSATQICKYCQATTDINLPHWWRPDEVCPKKPTQETWREKVLVG